MRLLMAAMAAPCVLFIVPSHPVAASPGCPGTASRPSRAPSGTTSWAVNRYQPARLAGIADGAGIVVGVLDSGVDATHPELRGRVLPGKDELSGTDGRVDCVAHGTAVAGIIESLAPGARILPVRVTEQEGSTGTRAGRTGSPAGVAAGIRWAVNHGATVLNLSFTLANDERPVRDAVRYALDHDVVVVAAVGNRAGTGSGPDPVPYPAAYPGVLGVGAIGPDGQLTASCPVGPFVDLTAPGGDILAAAPGGHDAIFEGTSFAAPFVAATAALIRQREPRLTADQVAARILATADPGPRRSGAGVVNPYRAVSEVALPTGSAPARLPLPAVATGRTARRSPGEAALLVAAVAVMLAGGVLLGAAVTRRGRARNWRTGPLS